MPNFYDREVANKAGGSMEATATRTLDSVQTSIMKDTKLTNKEMQAVGRELTATGPVRWQSIDSNNFSESRMAILPTLQHNNLLASLLGPGRYQQDIWIGVYNHAYYDYYFR